MAESTARPDNTYRLVLFDVPDDPAPVRDLICGVTGLHAADAMQWIANTPGVVRHPLAEGEARELLDGLFELKVPAEAWRLDAIPVLGPARTARDVACTDDGFRVRGLRGEPMHWVPWEKMELIAAGRVEQPDEVRAIVPPGWVRAASAGLNAVLRRPQMIARRERSIRIAREAVGEAILVRSDPRIAFRCSETQLNYAYLGDRLRPSASENFPLFLADVCQRATSAYLPKSTKVMLEGGDPADCLFESTQSLLDYATHRLLWSWYRRDRERNRGRDGDFGADPTTS
jgi:hypothetical protein